MIALLQRARRRMRAEILRLARDSGAVVMIEMAFCIPLLVLVGFAGIELANLTMAHTRVSQIGLSAADNASRIAFGSNLSLPRVREIDINEVFTGVEEQARGMNFQANGRIILSSLERNPDGGQWIKWQRCYGNLDIDSAYGPQGTGATGTGFAGMGATGREVAASIPATAWSGRRPVVCRRPIRTCKIFQSAPKPAARSVMPSSLRPAIC